MRNELSSSRRRSNKEAAGAGIVKKLRKALFIDMRLCLSACGFVAMAVVQQRGRVDTGDEPARRLTEHFVENPEVNELIGTKHRARLIGDLGEQRIHSLIP